MIRVRWLAESPAGMPVFSEPRSDASSRNQASKMESGLNPRTLPRHERRLELLMEMDSLRDDAEGPDDFLSGIVEVRDKALGADTCLLFVTDPSLGDQELWAIQNHSDKLCELPSEDLASLSRGRSPPGSQDRDPGRTPSPFSPGPGRRQGSGRGRAPCLGW